MKRFFLFFVCFGLLSQSVFAYTTYQTTQGPLKIYFGEPNAVTKAETITELDTPLTVKATLENLSDAPLSLKLTFRTIETIEFPEAESKKEFSRPLQLGAKETKTTELTVVARPGTYTAHYPVHLIAEFEQNGKPDRAHVVLVIETKVPLTGSPKNPLLGKIIENAKELPLNTLPAHGGLFLSMLNTYRGVWNYDGKPVEILPIGFNGSDKQSAASIHRQNMQRGGEFRQSIDMHPPYRGGIGNVGMEYRIQLPETTPIMLNFFSAMRDVTPPETPSDGVTFRVLVDGEKVYEKHNAETTWVENEVELSRYSGKEILLRLESDPGPKRNTNCDSCFWGDVMLFAGEKPAVLSAGEKQTLFAENLTALKTGKESARTQVFKLDGGLTGAVTFGNNAFLDGVIGVGNAEKQIQFDGLRIWIKGQQLGGWPCAVALQRAPDVSPRVTLHLDIDGRKETLTLGILQNGPALQFPIDASADDLIDRIEFGPATHTADRVYFGHGYCISQPERFAVSAGGHNLSTSHVGMDFDNGLSVLQATSFPVDRFIVDPERKLYTLSVHPGTTITLLPGLEGALDCAVRYRPICPYKAAPGVKSKAGRFVFDVWGGKYQEHVETIRHAVRYGLTDAQFIVHNWQRWGYDNRLPDIWPPNPRWGTLEEMQQALAICDKHGIQYGVHDNYIDFYPDAEEFDFGVTTFHENGQPRKAWINHGIDAQSYQFRPDRVQKFLERNLDLMVPELPMSTYFVDVFVSIPPIDYYDRDGIFHSRVESRAAWNKAFDTIRDRLSKANKNFPSANASSEAGMDSLIGHLDGADCQFMFLSDEPGEFRMRIGCKKWSRVPWFDAVHHTTFSLHGVGYSNRYETGRGRAAHGIESDDYITSEILTGHSLMVDWGSARRGAVRKYWLAQDLIRHLADKEIVKVEFADGNIFRQIITWNDGTTIGVNLGDEDWPAGPDHLPIPPFGYFVNEPISSGIVRVGDRVVEFSATFKSESNIVHYVNARQKGGESIVPLTPSLNSFEYLGENRFKADFAWEPKGEIDRDLCVFVHCTEKRMNWHQKLKEAVFAGGYPKTPTSQWKEKTVSDPYTMAVPDDLPEGRYYFVVGLYDSKGDGRRASLIGQNTGSDRYAVAWLKVERKGESLGEGKLNRVSNISCEAIEWKDGELYERLLPPKEPVDFGICKTKGAFRIEIDRAKKIATVTPLPGEPDTEISLRIPEAAKSVQAIDADGKELRNVPFENEAGLVRVTTKAGEFSYRIVW